MSGNNLELWNSLKTTDQQYTKTGNEGGRRVTSINGHYVIEVATKAFGPIGIGWGYNILEEYLRDGVPVYSNINNVRTLEGREQNHTLRLELWYMLDGKKAAIPDFGHTKYLYFSRKKSYWICDEEVGKKSLTDAIKRCLSKIGVCADIFMGEFDNRDYQVEAAQITKLEKDKIAISEREARQKQEVEEHQGFIDAIEACKSVVELKRLWPNIDAKALLMTNGPKRVQELMKIYIDKLKGLENE